jgi:hypothetical protein
LLVLLLLVLLQNVQSDLLSLIDSSGNGIRTSVQRSWDTTAVQLSLRGTWAATPATRKMAMLAVYQVGLTILCSTQQQWVSCSTGFSCSNAAGAKLLAVYQGGGGCDLRFCTALQRLCAQPRVAAVMGCCFMQTAMLAVYQASCKPT